MFLPDSEGFGRLCNSFTYQGHLARGAHAVSGEFDFCFTLFSTPLGGVAVTQAVTNPAVIVDSNGVFTTTIDFGAGVFNGDDRWLEIAVRANGSGAFTPLAPRQRVARVPMALFSLGTPNYSGPVSASQLTGPIRPALLPAGWLTNNAASMPYDATRSGLPAGNVQAASRPMGSDLCILHFASTPEPRPVPALIQNPECIAATLFLC